MLKFAENIEYINVADAESLRARLEKGERTDGVFLVFLNAAGGPGGNIFEIIYANEALRGFSWLSRRDKPGVVVCACASEEDARGYLLETVRRFAAGGGDMARMREVLYKEACGDGFTGAV